MFPRLCLATLALLPIPQTPGAPMTTRVQGPFDVKLTPQPPGHSDSPWAPGRMAIDKQFHGDLEATSQGEMLMVNTGTKGSAGYVAIERVRGVLKGRRGTFLLQHSGLMARGAGKLTISVVPDSGTEELAGLEGRMDILIADGKHSYVFDYSLPVRPPAPSRPAAPGH